MDKKITYIFPSRSRRVAFFKCVQNIIDLSASPAFEIICVLDVDDPEMHTEAVKAKIATFPCLTAYWGLSSGKIAACNRELDKISPETEIVILHSDDMVITKSGFDNDIREAAKDYSGIIHFPDGNKNRKLTYPVLTKAYFELDKFIYHPDFISVYADDFQAYLAKKRKLYKFVALDILKHNHYRFGFGEPDDLMKHNDSGEMYKKDRDTFFKLKKTYKAI